MTSDIERIDSLARIASHDSAQELQEIEQSTADKEVRKAARKALYKLSQAGIVPEKRKQTALTDGKVDSQMQAFASAFDGAGNRLVLLLLHDPDGGSATLLHILTNDQEGVKDCDVVKVQRKSIDSAIERILGQVESGLAIAPVETDFARWLLAQSRALSTSRSKRTPTSLLVWIPRIGETSTEFEPPIYTRVTAEEIQADTGIPYDPAELFKLNWFEPWFFAAEDALPWLGKWNELTQAAEGSLNAEPGTPTFDLVTDAAKGMMTPSMRALYVRRLEETADILWRCGKQPQAKQALYHALALKSEAGSSEIPFAREIAYRTLGAAYEMMRAYNEQRRSG